MSSLPSWEMLFGPPAQQSQEIWAWATVESEVPLRIRFDGETDVLPYEPDSLEGALTTGDRVWCQISEHRVIIHGSGQTSDTGVWHVVGAPGEPQYKNGWGPGLWTMKFKVMNNNVHIVGGADPTNVSSNVVFTLPTWAIPSQPSVVTCWSESSDYNLRCDINPAIAGGDVRLLGPHGTSNIFLPEIVKSL